MSEQILVSILSVPMHSCCIFWNEAAVALTPLCWDLKPQDLLTEALPSDVALQVKFIPESSSASQSIPWESGQTWTR